MKVADTSFLFALFDRADPRQADAAKRFQEGPVVIPTEVLVELVGAMGHKIGRAPARKALQALVQQTHVLIDGRTDADRALALYAKHAGLSLVDACVVAACEARGCGVLCYDDVVEGLVGPG